MPEKHSVLNTQKIIPNKRETFLFAPSDLKTLIKIKRATKNTLIIAYENDLFEYVSVWSFIK